MRNRRDRRGTNKLVVHITNRTVCGFPFVCRLFMSLIIRMLLAKAQTLFPVQVCHIQWMGNHFHMILAGRGAAISSFMGHFEGELAKYIELIVPKLFQRSVWEGRFKEQRLCTATDVLDKIIYIYANPARANLVKSISEWPGVSSWKMYKSGTYGFYAKFVKLKDFKHVAKKIGSYKDSRASRELSDLGCETVEFRLSFNAWKRCFKESVGWSDEYIYNLIKTRLAERERLLGHERGTNPVLGVFGLRHQSIRQHYRPESRRHSPFLICHDSELRKQFVNSYRDFCRKCSDAWNVWKHGYFSAVFPPGCYRPGTPVIAAVA